jgi:hypothetical protein
VLSSISEATSLSEPSNDDAASLADIIFAPGQLDSLCAILTSESRGSTIQEQKNLVLSVICHLCKDARHQHALANTGILDILATMLASFVVSRGEVVPGAEDQNDGMAEWRPNAAPRGARLTDTLAAISAIMADSRFRASMLLYSPAIMAVFPNMEFSAPTQQSTAVRSTLQWAGMSSNRAKSPGAMEYLLPVIPAHQSRGHGPYQVESKDSVRQYALSGWEQGGPDTPGSNGETEFEDSESPLIPWLIHLVRSSTGLDRVLAASILASLFSAGFASSEREMTIGLVVVPILCHMLKEGDHDRDNSASADAAFITPDTALVWSILERTPTVLSRLIADSELLQQAAFDAGVVEVACKLLRDSYEPLPAQSIPRPWSPVPDRRQDQGDGHAAHQVGQPGRPPLYAHRMKLRESSLMLIAGLLSFKKEYREAVVAQESMPYIVESLVPCPGKPKSVKERPKLEKGATVELAMSGGSSPYGNNSNGIMIAACHVIRSLGRSVDMVRTRLEDYGVAAPIFALLRSGDITVQVAACATMCNLVIGTVCPMRMVSAGYPFYGLP